MYVFLFLFGFLEFILTGHPLGGKVVKKIYFLLFFCHPLRNHSSFKTQRRLSENLYDFTSPNLWPPNSPDCNPMDYYVWGAVEKDTNRSACNTKAELVAKIKEVFEDLPRDTVRDACARFRSRLEAVVEADGGHFE